MDTLLKDFPVVTEIRVAWGEMDALQHVNNVVYFRYFETARLDYFEAINLLVDLQTSQISPVLSETQCRYKLPVTYPDTLMIGARVIDMQGDRMTMEYQVFSKKWGKVVTVATATGVMFDFKNNTKTEIPDSVRKSILELEATVGSTHHLE
ncbi:thioesterase family protein [Vibrio natriegens]|uniref:acyl-CoA thioesterase n=1 Tax=Vibrio natriegens TaxID=691 RepID=UPI000804128D|nr:thioesterase family protein [Vibrio natriegens]ANQ28495.1 thioesterase [Vibrio natriegens]MCY9877206.1 thioesterase family protein [Vibrio natriegens]